jgi:uncharacterized membrane protein
VPNGIHLEEYRLVQEKIDKIGEFRFIVRGWAVTLATAIVGAAEIAKLHPGSMLLAIIALGVFAAVERQQERVGDTLGRRARHLETYLQIVALQAVKGIPVVVVPAPRIAADLLMMPKPRGLDRPLQWTHRNFYLILSSIIVLLVAVRVLLPEWDPEKAKPAPVAQPTTKQTPPTNSPAGPPAPRKKHR